MATDFHDIPASILVVDEDVRHRRQVADLVASRGHRVVAVDETADAIERLSEETFDVVISPWNLSEVDGLTFLSRVREYHPHQEAIFFATEAELESVIPMLGEGIASHVLTPIEEQSFFKVFDEAIQRAFIRRGKLGSGREIQDSETILAIGRRGLELFAVADIDLLYEKILEDFSVVTDAQSAALWLLEDSTEFRLVAHRGLFQRAAHQRPWMRDEQLLHRVSEGTPWVRAEASGPFLQVPLKAFREPLGFVQLGDSLHREFRSEVLGVASQFSEFAAVALKNGRRLKSLERLGLRDRETSAYNLSYFTDYASKEIYKARRYGRIFSLITLSIDHLANLRHRLGAEQALKSARGVIRSLTKLARDTDVLAKAGEQEFYMLLPETDFFGALMFLRRTTAAIAADPEIQAIESRFPLGIVGGIATFPKDGEDFDELMASCYRRMGERRTSLLGKMYLESKPFWESLELLLGQPQSAPLPVDELSPPSVRGHQPTDFWETMGVEVGHEIERNSSTRGLVFATVPQIHQSLPLLQALEKIGPTTGTRVFVLGRRGDIDSHSVATLVFLDADERLSKSKSLLWLSEFSAYAVAQSSVHSSWCFQTSDSAVVECLISRLQSEYQLQTF